MRTRLALAAVLALVLTFASGMAQGTAQQPQANMPDMMKMHEQMMAEMKAEDARLDALVRDMNAATGNARIDAMAAVLNELLQQRKAMHERMGKMSEHMMGGMKMHR